MATPTRKQVILSIISGIAGFVAGSVGLGLQLAPFFKSAEVVSLAPEQVLFILYQNPEGDVEMLRLAAVQRHINTNTVGKAAILVRETATLEIAGVDYEYKWQSLENFQVNKGELVSTNSNGAHPSVLGPGAVESHETYFAPETGSVRFKKWEDFVSLARQAPEVNVRFVAHFHDGSSTATNCKVELTDKRLARLESRKWDAPTCQDEEAGSLSAS